MPQRFSKKELKSTARMVSQILDDAPVDTINRESYIAKNLHPEAGQHMNEKPISHPPRRELIIEKDEGFDIEDLTRIS